MVRLVFRPYTQVRRSICTSESLRASTRVSPGFTLPRHSSPSIGSQQACSVSMRLAAGLALGRCRMHRATRGRRCFCFRCAPQCGDCGTRKLAELLGPCFKTGRLGRRSRRAPASRPKDGDVPERCNCPSAKPCSVTGQPRLARHLAECTLGSAVPIASLPAISRTFDSFFKVLFIFPSRYLFAIGLSSVFSLRWSLPPALDCNPKQPDSWPGVGASPPAHTGLSPSLATISTIVRTGGLRAQPGSKLQLGAQWAQITSLGSSRFTRSYWGNPC
jgi:hypothetical protein